MITKLSKYTVKYKNGRKNIFRCMNFQEAAILANADILRARIASGIDKITDEYGMYVENVDVFVNFSVKKLVKKNELEPKWQ